MVTKLFSVVLYLPFFINHCIAQQDYQAEALQMHNTFRDNHGSNPMTLDNTLNFQAIVCAQDYAERQSIDGQCSINLQKGENMFMTLGSEPPAFIDIIKTAVETWYSKNVGYSYTDPANSDGGITKHYMFTQVVWKASTKLGCGIRTVSDTTVTVCLYDPQGNIFTPDGGFQYFIQNVTAPGGGSPPPTSPPPTPTPPSPSPPPGPTPTPPSPSPPPGPTPTPPSPSPPPPTSPPPSPTPTPPFPSPPPDTPPGDFQSAAIELHNMLRGNHGAQAMTLDDQLNSIAQQCSDDYARRRVVDNSCPFKTDEDGENIFFRSSSESAPTEFMISAINSWYSEVSRYNFNDPGSSVGIVGHFTQLVWNSSIRLGCGVTIGTDESYAVCLYVPRGNEKATSGDEWQFYKANVFPPL